MGGPACKLVFHDFAGLRIWSGSEAGSVGLSWGVLIGCRPYRHCALSPKNQDGRCGWVRRAGEVRHAVSPQGAPNDRNMTVSDRDMTVTQGDTHRGWHNPAPTN